MKNNKSRFFFFISKYEEIKTPGIKDLAPVKYQAKKEIIFLIKPSQIIKPVTQIKAIIVGWNIKPKKRILLSLYKFLRIVIVSILECSISNCCLLYNIKFIIIKKNNNKHILFIKLIMFLFVNDDIDKNSNGPEIYKIKYEIVLFDEKIKYTNSITINNNTNI